MKIIQRYVGIDWILFLATMPLLAAGLISMRSFGVGSDYYFTRQLLWIGIGIFVFFVFSLVDWRFLRKSELLAGFFVLMSFFLAALLVFGLTVKGAGSRLYFWFFFF